MQSDPVTFWDHLEELRGCLIRIFAVTVVAAVATFFMREPVFRIILAPTHGHFFLYRLMGAGDFHLHLINTGLAEQMMIHLRISLYVGFVLSSPYIIYVLYGFISPALYAHEQRYSIRLLVAAYIMFMVGLALNYSLIFPLTVRFLGLYQVSPDVDNMLTISSYIDTLLMMSLTFGIVFEIPVLSWLLARFGLIRAAWMTRFRRHAIVAILVVAAIITPTSDAFTLMLVALPIWLLYEASILIVRRTICTKGSDPFVQI